MKATATTAGALYGDTQSQIYIKNNSYYNGLPGNQCKITHIMLYIQIVAGDYTLLSNQSRSPPRSILAYGTLFLNLYICGCYCLDPFERAELESQAKHDHD